MPPAGRPRVAFAIQGPIARADLPGLCARVCALLPASGAVDCDVGSVEPDAVTVDALARLQLAARRRGCEVRLRDASPSLLELVHLMGLTHVLPDEPPGVGRDPAPPPHHAPAARRDRPPSASPPPTYTFADG